MTSRSKLFPTFLCLCFMLNGSIVLLVVFEAKRTGLDDLIAEIKTYNAFKL